MKAGAFLTAPLFTARYSRDNTAIDFTSKNQDASS
jgi:hypothetical protein